MNDEFLIDRKRRLISDLHDISKDFDELLDNYDDFVQVMKNNLLVDNCILYEKEILDGRTNLRSVKDEVLTDIILKIK